MSTSFNLLSLFAAFAGRKPFARIKLLLIPSISILLAVFGFSCPALAQETDSSRPSMQESVIPSLVPFSDSLKTPYGISPHSEFTGAAMQLGEKDFNPGLITSLEQLILGKTPGLLMTSRGGAPGEGYQLRIRGNSSIFQSNEPLIVLDGLPLYDETFLDANPTLSYLHPDDIENITILKGAEAISQYGARAANGVVFIQLKESSRSNQPTFRFRTLSAVSSLRRPAAVLSATEFRALVKERGTAEAQALLGSASTNWQDEIYQHASSHDQHLSLSGKLKFLPYRLSVGYLDNEGIVETSQFKRSTLGLSLSPRFLDDHLKIGVQLLTGIRNLQHASPAAIGAALAFDPTQQVYTQNRYGGYYTYLTPDGLPNLNAPYNPLSLLEQREEHTKERRSIGSFHLQYAIHGLPSLQANVRLGFASTENNYHLLEEASLAKAYHWEGIQRSSERSIKNQFGEFYLNYTRELSAISSGFSLVAGLGEQNFFTQYQESAIYNANGDKLYDTDLGTERDNTTRHAFANLQYRLKNRYFLSASIRKDGSPYFMPTEKDGVSSHSLGLSWLLSEEAFLKNSALITGMKVRLEYGATGYEQMQSFSGGLDFELLRGLVSGSLDYYHQTSDNLLLLIPVPRNSGPSVYMKWGGGMENKGIDAAFRIAAIRSEQVNWSFGLNATFSKNIITNLLELNNLSAGPFVGLGGETLQVHKVGESFSSFHAYQQVYTEKGAPIEGAFVDVDDDNLITRSDKQIGPTAEPFLATGFHSRLRHKKWDLSFLFRSHLGNYLYNELNARRGAYENISYPGSGYLTNLSANVLETNFQRPQLLSDYYIENASFLGMENISLGYAAGSFLHNKVNLSLRASLENALVLTAYSGTDPEIAGGIERSHYPRPRTFSLAADFRF